MIRAYSNPDRDFGLFGYAQTNSPVTWLGVFTAGFDGNRVQIEATRREDGFFDAFLLAPTKAGDEFPPMRSGAKPKLGLIEIVADSEDALTLRYVFDRYLLGYPAIDFSPMPERDVTGTLTLARVI